MNMGAMCRSLLAFVGALTNSCHRGLPDITFVTDGVWASFFALFYRKFFWDFVGGILRDPGGLQ